MRFQPETHAAFQLISIANRLTASASQTYLKTYGVGIMEWRVLAMLAPIEGASANDISHISGVDKSAISRASQSLVKRGLIAGADDPKDNRRTLLSLTDEGRALHDRIIRASAAREQLLLDGFSPSDRAELFQLLGRLAANLPLVEAHKPAAEA
jgi:DNA-binding MarR family transcriptional regulator